MSEGKIKVLYIAGPTRSGSTILSNILGEVDGFFNAGELIDIWDRGLASNGMCGCGTQVRDCKVWRKVLDLIINCQDKIDLQEMIKVRNRVARSSLLPLQMVIPAATLRSNLHLKKYLSNLKNLYRAVQIATNSKIIVDSSKNAGYANLLAMIPEIDLYIIHLIRDPRAVAYSWLRKKEGLWQIKPLKSSLMWNIRVIAPEMLRKRAQEKYLRIYYEDFIEKPQTVIKHILEMVQENPSNLPFITEHTVKLGFNHSIYGNPNRFHAGKQVLKIDNEWKRMKISDKIIVTLLTWPLLFKHGYLRKY